MSARRNCPKCYGEGTLPSVGGMFARDIAVLLIICGIAAATVFASFTIGFNEGRIAGLSTACPKPECPAPPKPTCVKELPRNCGRIGSEKIVCLRNSTDELRFGVMSPSHGVDDPVILYLPDELLTKQLPDGGLSDEQ